jgi:hypothetical protein
LLPDDDALEIEFDFANLMRGDAASRSAYYQSGIQNGWLTRNEARVAENLNPIAGLDQPLRPLNMVEEEDAEEAENEADPNADASDTDASPEPEAEPEQVLNLRLKKLVESNAQRLARRICKKGALSANDIELIAQTFGLPPARVESRLTSLETLTDEQALAGVLIELGIHA